MRKHLTLVLLVAFTFHPEFRTRVIAQREAPRGNDLTNDTLSLATDISEVTVYLEGAQVTRQADLDLPAGRSAVILTDLTAKLDKRSLQIKAPGVTILSVRHQLNFYEAPEEQADNPLRNRVEELARAERRLRTEADILRAEQEILKQNRSIAGQQTGVNSADLERAVAFHRERVRAIRLGFLTLEDSLQTITEQRKLLLEQLATEGRAAQRPTTSEIIVLLESSGPQRTPITCNYRVPQAGWAPRYDVRVDDLTQPIDLRYRAGVYQESGENWTGVNLTLSTGDPSRSALAPELVTWRVSPGVYPPTPRMPTDPGQVNFGYRQVKGVVVSEENQALIGASVTVEGTDIGTVTDVNGNFSIDMPAARRRLLVSYTGFTSKTVLADADFVRIALEENSATLDEVVIVGYAGSDRANTLGNTPRGNVSGAREKRQESTPLPVEVGRRATTVTFKIELPYTINSTGEPFTVDIRRFAVPARFDHYAVPKASPDAYLTAAVTDWDKYDLISGEAQLFFEGTYLGNTYLDTENTSDTLELSLGRDPSVIVTREPDEEFTKVGGLIAGRRSVSRGWRLAVRNTKAQPINLTLVDQAPLSGQNNIDVKTGIPDAARMNETTGIITWELRLAARAEWTGKFSYEVKYPRDTSVFVE